MNTTADIVKTATRLVHVANRCPDPRAAGTALALALGRFCASAGLPLEPMLELARVGHHESAAA